MEHQRSLRGVLKKYARPLSTDELRDTGEEALAKAAAEDWARENVERSRQEASKPASQEGRERPPEIGAPQGYAQESPCKGEG
jgi:hypothetical protein